MSNTTLLFLTNGIIYDYKDGIYDNRNNNNTFIRWSGQKK